MSCMWVADFHADQRIHITNPTTYIRGHHKRMWYHSFGPEVSILIHNYCSSKNYACNSYLKSRE